MLTKNKKSPLPDPKFSCVLIIVLLAYKTILPCFCNHPNLCFLLLAVQKTKHIKPKTCAQKWGAIIPKNVKAVLDLVGGRCWRGFKVQARKKPTLIRMELKG
jgi:hypothetical protein